MMGGFDFGMFGVGMLAMAVFWVLVIGGGIWLIVALARGSRQTPSLTAASGQSPLDLLNARYARGEITKEQFEQMKRDLGG